jgi:hypothetical protein
MPGISRLFFSLRARGLREVEGTEATLRTSNEVRKVHDLLSNVQGMELSSETGGTRIMSFPRLALFMALLSPVLLAPAYARGGGGGHGGGGGGARGGGGFSGGARGGSVGGFRGGSTGAFRGGSTGAFRGGVGGFRGGVGGFRGGYYGGRYYGGFGFGVGWPYYGYGYPYYSSCGYDPYYCGYGYGYDPYYSYDPGYPSYTYSTPPPATYGYPQTGQSQPPPAYYPPQQQTQTQAAAPAGTQGQNYYLIAFTDHTIQAATAYKVEGDTIHWMTREGQEKTAPLSTVDVRFSQQINRDRRVDFQIP